VGFFVGAGVGCITGFVDGVGIGAADGEHAWHVRLTDKIDDLTDTINDESSRRVQFPIKFTGGT
jgi:hypothetical protein